jgi:MFS family permease
VWNKARLTETLSEEKVDATRTGEELLNNSAPSKSVDRSFVYLAAAFAALGGLLFGYDTGVISGAELFFRRDFTLSTFALEVIVSGVLAGAAVGALAGGWLADLFGRRKLLIATAIIFAAGAILCAAAQSPQILVAGRIIVGLGIGLSSSTVPVLLIRRFFASRDEFQAASGINSRIVDRRAVSRAAMAFCPVSVSW